MSEIRAYRWFIADLSRVLTKRDVRRVFVFFPHFEPIYSECSWLDTCFIKHAYQGQTGESCLDRVGQQCKHALCECTRRDSNTTRCGESFGVGLCWCFPICIGRLPNEMERSWDRKTYSFRERQINCVSIIWASIEKEAYAVGWALNKFCTWCFGFPVGIY